MFGIVVDWKDPEEGTTGMVASGGALRRSRRPRVLVWVLVGMLAGLIWALPQDPLLTRRVALTLRSAL